MRKHKKNCRCVVCSYRRSGKKRKVKRHARRTRKTNWPRRRSARIVSRIVPIETRSRNIPRVRRRRAVRRNPSHEFVVEAYKPKGHKFYYLETDDMLTTDRNKAARYREKIHAMAKAKYVRDRVPRGIEWVRVCPA